ncbi:MAG: S41 family peptidase [Chloroflexi bacterium]|nr:S41 family peptidase [Chloroflexota bacterium]
MTSPRRYRLMLFSLVLVMAGAAFALGVGVTGLIDDGAPALSAREVRSAATAQGVDPAAIDVRFDERDSRFSLLDEVYAILDRDFVEPDRVDLDRFRTAAINGIVAALNDPHSAYLEAEDFRLNSEDISGVFQGIGATVNLQPEGVTISSVFRGSPAEAAGMRADDLILTVDGESAEGWSLQFAVSRIRGERGTPVVIMVRHRDGREEELTIIRDDIIVPSVQSLQIQDRLGNVVTDIAYILITQYTSRTRDELVPLLQAVEAAGLDTVIIDLRGNPGGLLTATVDTTGEFLDGGLVLTQVDRDGSTRDFSAARGGAGLDLRVVLLVDGGSASGSEVMAAALRDHGRAVLIGEQTLGKGTVNIPRTLSDGSVLYVSVARWLTPNGELIEGIGVIPDIEVILSDDDFTARRDAQLFAAIEFLRGGASPPSGGLG